ncbi:MAG: hypothetical protein R3F59_29060 [Myxococcota bacterium]
MPHLLFASALLGCSTLSKYVEGEEVDHRFELTRCRSETHLER